MGLIVGRYHRQHYSVIGIQDFSAPAIYVAHHIDRNVNSDFKRGRTVLATEWPMTSVVAPTPCRIMKTK